MTTLAELSGYYDRTDESKHYENLLFVASRALQSAECNEAQIWLLNRFKNVLSFVFRDGAVLSGTPPTLGTPSNNLVTITLPATQVYIRGGVYSVPARSFSISSNTLVHIGVLLTESVATADDDASLRDPAIGARNYHEVGAARLKVLPTWAKEGDGQPFYSVYTINNGVVVDQNPPALSDLYLSLLRRYDYESNGSYIVRGLTVNPLPWTSDGATFSVSEGVGNIRGYKVDRYVSERVVYAEDPDLEAVTAEPHVFTGITGGIGAIQLNRYPVQAITGCLATFQKTVTLTKGVAGGQDALPDVSILAIQDVHLGGTTYVVDTDYYLNADKVDWSPAGAEPTQGQSYSVTYTYLASATPTSLNANLGTFNVTGPVNGTVILTSYTFKLPRIDRVCIDNIGTLTRIKGISSRFTINPPPIPEGLLSLATVYSNWGATPAVVNDGVRVIPFSQLEQIRSMVVNLYDLVAQQKLLNDINLREPAAKLGVFVDPLVDDTNRDQGLAQTGAVFAGLLTCPITPTVMYPDAAANRLNNSLPFTPWLSVAQGRVTGSIAINPYQAFAPIPVSVTLYPAVDQWQDHEITWASPTTQYFNEYVPLSQLPAGIAARSTTTREDSRTAILGTNEQALTYLRQIAVGFTLSGFDAGETLTTCKFDGVTVAASATANGQGIATGSFTIPSGILAGTKLVEFWGNQGNYGSGWFVGNGTIETSTLQQINTITTRLYDPLAQTFKMAAVSTHICGISLYFTAIGSTANPIYIEIRECENGTPTSRTLVDGVIQAGTITLNTFTYIPFSRTCVLLPNVEYALVVLTDDAYHSVGIAELGRYDTTGTPVSAQPYTVGTLLKSSNASTWTPFQEADLSFFIWIANFSPTTLDIPLGKIYKAVATSVTQSTGVATFNAVDHGFLPGDEVLIYGAVQTDYNGTYTVATAGANSFTYPISGNPTTPATGTVYAVPSNITDLIVLANVERTDNTTDCYFTIDTPTQSFKLADNAGLALGAVLTEPATITAHLRGTEWLSPLLYAGTQVVYGKQAATGDYISPAIASPPASTVRVRTDAQVPVGAGVTVEAQSGPSSWVTLSGVTGEDLGENWYEHTYTTTNLSAANNLTRIRITLSGTVAARPKLANLRTIITAV